MVCVLDSTTDLEEMHRRYVCNLQRENHVLSTPFMERQWATAYSLVEPHRMRVTTACEERSALCTANSKPHTSCARQTRPSFSKKQRLLFFFSFHTPNMFLLSNLIYVFNSVWRRQHHIVPSHHIFKGKSPFSFKGTFRNMQKIQMGLLNHNAYFRTRSMSFPSLRCHMGSDTL